MRNFIIHITLKIMNKFLLFLFTLFFGTLVYAEEPEYLCFTAETDSCTIGFVSLCTRQTLEYRISQGGTWHPITSYTKIIHLEKAGDKVYFRGMDSDSKTPYIYEHYLQFKMTGEISASGNIMSLLDYTQTLNKIPYSYCFRDLFKDCTALKNAPDMPADTLACECYSNMFNGCTGLVTPPNLPAQVLASNCYEQMFCGCTSLTYTPDLPAEKLAEGCYKNMFAYCSSLTKFSSFPATKLAPYCCSSMFYKCSNLTDIPVLPARTLTSHCYDNMFAYCSSIVDAPQILADTLASYCYYSMFMYCTSLKNPPKLNAQKLEDMCYSNMFTYCDQLDHLYISFSPSLSKENSYVSLHNVSDKGIVYCPDSLIIYLQENIPSGWIFETELNFKGLLCLKNISKYSTEVKLESVNNAPIVLYTEDFGVSWDTLKNGESHKFRNTSAPRIYIKGNNPNGFSHSPTQYTTFSINDADLSGSIMSLINGNGNDTIIPNDYCFYRLFKNNKNEITVELPATILTDNCYEEAFAGTKATSAPELPAKVLKKECYKGMFNYSSIVEPPVLPATELADLCYEEMFCYCENLETMPQLKATQLKERCYRRMFYGCAMLKEASELPATTMEKYCYNGMFGQCKRLKKAPIMPDSIILANRCFSLMFEDCDSLSGYPAVIMKNIMSFTAQKEGSSFAINSNSNYICKYSIDEGKTWQNLGNSTVILENIGDKAYIIGKKEYGSNDKLTFSITGDIYADGSVSSILDECASVLETETSLEKLFANCEGLTHAPQLPMQCLSTNANYRSMFLNCINLKEAPELPATTLSYACYNMMFKGCVQLKKAPKLPADSLSDACYMSMFSGCTNLEEAPELPATTLSYACYQNMFQNCKSLKKAVSLPALNLAQQCYDGMYKGCEKLEEAPELPALNLSRYCYASMFAKCISLEEAPSLPATKLAYNAYDAMFDSCVSLVNVPVLPAEYLPDMCYYKMFRNCKNLVEAPEIMAKNIGGDQGYSMSDMFKGCENLRHIKVNFNNWNNSTYKWVQGVPEGGLFECPDSLNIIYGENRIPTGWSVNGATDVPLFQKEETRWYNIGTIIYLFGTGEKISIYKANGQLLYTATVSPEGINFDLKNEGIYILRIGNKSQKLICRI